MIWRDNISDLAFYTNTGGPCYCEQLVYPSDLILQGVIPGSASSGFAITIEVLSADGLTTYEDATTYFEYYFFSYNGVRYFNLRLKSYSPAMCTYKCWILKVSVTVNSNVVFLKYTERYCQTNCCDVPRGITASVEGDVIEQSSTVVIPFSDCGKPLIRIRSLFDCVDNYNSDFYGTPTTVYSGTASFTFEKITNIVGRFKPRPREINREISFNCNLQRSESFKPWQIESVTDKGVFPEWKMDELEVMFHSNHIYISDFIEEKEYQFAGGIICEPIGLKCWDLFKLKTILQECTIRQLFGCAEGCEPGLTKTYLIPEGADGNFYSENKQLIGDYDDLLNWYRGQNGVTHVVDTSGEYDNTEHSFEVTGSGYIPTYFYYSSLIPRNKIYATTDPVAPEILCAMPVVGTIVVVEDECATPTIGSITVTDEEDDIAEVHSYELWTVTADSIIVLSGGYGFMYLESSNSAEITSPLGFYSDEIIGVITVPGRPSNPVSLSHDDNENIPEGSLLTIDTSGVVRYTGYATSYDSPVTITLPDIYYTL